MISLYYIYNASSGPFLEQIYSDMVIVKRQELYLYLFILVLYINTNIHLRKHE